MWKTATFLRSLWVLLLALLHFGPLNSEAAVLLANASDSTVYFGYQYHIDDGTIVKEGPIAQQGQTYRDFVRPPSVSVNSPWTTVVVASNAANFNAGIFTSASVISFTDELTPNLYVRLSEGFSERWVARLDWINNDADTYVFRARTSNNAIGWGSTIFLPGAGAKYSDRAEFLDSTVRGIMSQPPHYSHPLFQDFYYVPKVLDAVLPGTYELVWDGANLTKRYSISGEGQSSGVTAAPPGLNGAGGTNSLSGAGSTTVNVTNVVDLSGVQSAIAASGATTVAALGTVTSAVGAVATGIGSVISGVLGLSANIQTLITQVQTAYSGLVVLLTDFQNMVTAGFNAVTGFFDWVHDVVDDSNTWLASYQADLLARDTARVAAQSAWQSQFDSYFADAVADPSLGDPATYANASAGPPPLSLLDINAAGNGFGAWDYVLNLGLNTLRGVHNFIDNFNGFVLRFLALQQNYATGVLQAQIDDLQRQATSAPDARMMAFLESLEYGGRGELRDAVGVVLDKPHFQTFKDFLRTDSVQITGVQMVRADWVFNLPRGGGSGSYGKNVGGGGGAGAGDWEISLFPADHPKFDSVMIFVRCAIAWAVYLLLVWAAWNHFNVEVNKVQSAQLRAPPAGQSFFGNNANWGSVVANAAFYIALVLAFFTAYATMFVLFDVDCCGLSELMGLMNGSKESKMAVGLTNYVIPLDCIFQGLAGYVFFVFAWLPISTFWITALRVAHV